MPRRLLRPARVVTTAMEGGLEQNVAEHFGNGGRAAEQISGKKYLSPPDAG